MSYSLPVVVRFTLTLVEKRSHTSISQQWGFDLH